MHRSIRAILFTAAFLSAAVFAAAGQTRQATPRTVPVSVDLKIGSDSYQTAGPGTCTAAPQASIYDIRSQMWTAGHESGSGKSVRLTFWRPMDKSQDMFNLSANRVNVSTVRGGTPSGSGTVTFEPAGKGGVFRVNAKAANGTAIAGTIKCDAFLPHVAEGG